MELTQGTVYCLVGTDGTPAAVQVNWETWQRIVAALEDTASLRFDRRVAPCRGGAASGGRVGAGIATGTILARR